MYRRKSKMKKLLALVLAIALGVTGVVGCSPASSTEEQPVELKPITIGASPVPHVEILNVAKEVLAEQGYDLVIKEFLDYVQPNLAVDSGDLDANFFQHMPYLSDFNAKNNTTLVSAGVVHYEPLGLYAGKTKTIAELADGAKIAVPNDTTNEARALLLLETQGIIKIREGAGLTATKIDIVENPKNIEIVEIGAEQLARSLPDVDMAVINGNYAIQAGLNASSDALAKEEKDSAAAKEFANIVAVRAGDESREEIKALMSALQSEKVKKYIEDTYQGAVVPMF